MVNVMLLGEKSRERLYPKWKRPESMDRMVPCMWNSRKGKSGEREQLRDCQDVGGHWPEQHTKLIEILHAFLGWWKFSTSWLWWWFQTADSSQFRSRFTLLNLGTLYCMWYTKRYTDDVPSIKGVEGKAHGKNQSIGYFFWKFHDLGILGIRIVSLTRKIKTKKFDAFLYLLFTVLFIFAFLHAESLKLVTVMVFSYKFFWILYI